MGNVIKLPIIPRKAGCEYRGWTIVHENLRPPGHITDVVRSLAGWIGAMKNKGLKTRELETAKAYIEEYHELQQAVARSGLSLTRINGVLTLTRSI